MATTTTTAVAADSVSQKRAEGQWAVVVRRFTRHRMAMVSLIVLIAFLVLSVIAPWVAPYPRDQFNLSNQFAPPMSVEEETGNLHVLGTDHLGRDNLTRVIYAARVSLVVALLTATLSSVIGITLGLLAGFFLGWVDIAITRTLEFISTFPLFTILLILNSLLIQNPDLIPIPGWFNWIVGFTTGVPDKEQQRLSLLVLALALLLWTTTARLMRGMVLSVRELAYIESSRALGASNRRIITRHVLPNSFPPMIVDYTLQINGILVLESALSLLGYGVQDPTPTWGNMLTIAQANMLNHPWMPLIGGIPLMICALAVNFVGDGLRDALDPRAILGGKGARVEKKQKRKNAASAAKASA